jgi:hypothetical protein
MTRCARDAGDFIARHLLLEALRYTRGPQRNSFSPARIQNIRNGQGFTGSASQFRRRRNELESDRGIRIEGYSFYRGSRGGGWRLSIFRMGPGTPLRSVLATYTGIVSVQAIATAAVVGNRCAEAGGCGVATPETVPVLALRPCHYRKRLCRRGHAERPMGLSAQSFLLVFGGRRNVWR